MILGVSAEQEELRARSGVSWRTGPRCPGCARLNGTGGEDPTGPSGSRRGTQLRAAGPGHPGKLRRGRLQLCRAGGRAGGVRRRAVRRAGTWPAPCWPATALLASQDEGARRGLLPDIASGQTVATLAFTEDGGSWDPAAIRLSAVKDGPARWGLVGWTGTRAFVLDGATAGLILVVAATDAGLSLFA